MSVSDNSRYEIKHNWYMTIFSAIIALIVGLFGGAKINESTNMNYLERIEKANEKLNKEIENYKKDYEILENEKNELQKELDNSFAEAFPEGHYFPSTGKYLLDDYEINNGQGYTSFADSTVKMKGQQYNNGIILHKEGEITFYLKNEYSMLEFLVGAIDNELTDLNITIKVYVDGKQMNQVINKTYDQDCQKYSFNLEKCNELKIQWEYDGSSIYLLESYAIADMKIYK